MVNYYLSEKEKEIYNNFYSKEHLKENLDVTIIKNGIIVGFHQEENNYWQSAGVFDENKCAISDVDKCTCLALAKDIPQEPLQIHKTAIFLGSLNNKWGHFILEGISTLWYLLDNDYTDCDLVINVPENFPDNFFEVFELFGIPKNRLTINTGVLQYDQVIIPSLSFTLDNYYSNEYKMVIDRIKSKIEPIYNDKIYFSREKFNTSNNFFGEKEISKIFKENGYKVFYPEELSIVEKIAILKGGKSFACITASCAHNLVFANEGAEAIILERCSDVNTAQALINIMQNFETYYVNSHYSFLPVASGWGPFILGVNSFNSKFFKEKNFHYDEQVMEKINDYIIPYLAKWQKIFKNSKGVMNYTPLDNEALRTIEQILNVVFVEGKTPFVDKLIENAKN